MYTCSQDSIFFLRWEDFGTSTGELGEAHPLDVVFRKRNGVQYWSCSKSSWSFGYAKGNWLSFDSNVT